MGHGNKTLVSLFNTVDEMCDHIAILESFKRRKGHDRLKYRTSSKRNSSQ